MTKNEILTALLTLDCYAPSKLLQIVQRWQENNKIPNENIVYSMNDEGAFNLYANCDLTHFCSDDRFLTFDDELNGVISALNISDLIDLSIIADDIAENDLVHYYFGRAFISNA